MSTFLLLLSCCLCTFTILRASINATSSNSTAAVYNASVYHINSGNYFQSQNITCNKSYCHIICDEYESCFNLSVTATPLLTTFVIDCSDEDSCNTATIDVNTDSFHMHCTGFSSCYFARIVVAMSNTADIDCTDIYACKQATFNLTATAPDANVNILCNYTESSPCNMYDCNTVACSMAMFEAQGYSTQLTDKSNNISYICDGGYDCSSTSFKVSDFDTVHVECAGRGSCSNAAVYAATSNQLNVLCGSWGACSGTQIYCPYQHKGVCHIKCMDDDGQYVCSSMDIYVESNYVYDYLELTGDGKWSSSEVHCTDYMNVSSSDMYMPSPISSTNGCSLWGIIYTPPMYCCPYFEGNIFPCSGSTDCDVDCGSIYDACKGAIINGTAANYLTVTCGSSNCTDALIYCPVGGCSITCFGAHACEHAHIYYPETLTVSNDGNVSVNCLDGHAACYDVRIYAEYANEIDINCLGDFFLDERTVWWGAGRDYICHELIVNGEYANKVNIAASGNHSLYSSMFYITNAKAVTISANLNGAFWNNELHAENADLVTIKCVGSDRNTPSACYYNDWYLPSNTIFNCYGSGCTKLGNLYVTNDASKTHIVIHGCDQCENIDDCVDEFVLLCQESDHYAESETFYEFSSCSSVHIASKCGCYEMVNNINYTNSDNGNCYRAPNVSGSGWGTAVVIGAVIGVVSLIIIMAVVYVVHSRRKSKHVAAQLSELTAEKQIEINSVNNDTEQKGSEQEGETDTFNGTHIETQLDENEKKNGGTVTPHIQNDKMKSFMGELEELIGIIQKHLDFMDKQDSVVEAVINQSNEKQRLQSAKNVALKNEKELLEQIMNYNKMNEFLNDIILIENMFNALYAPQKQQQEKCRNQYAPNIELYENKQKPLCEVASFVDLLFDGTMIGIGQFKKWLKKVELECKKQGIEIIDSSGVKAKNIERAFYKAFYVYGINDINGGFKRMSDVLRCSLVFADFEHLYRCFSVIEQLSDEGDNGGILRCKDRFYPQSIEFGYRDLLINMYCPHSKIVCEIQLHYVLFYKHKKISHVMYKKARLFEDAESGQNLAYRYADKNCRKYVGDKIYELPSDAKNNYNEAYKLLDDWNLDKYAEILIDEEGYDDIEHWEELTVDRLQEMGFKEGHAKKFVKLSRSLI